MKNSSKALWLLLAITIVICSPSILAETKTWTTDTDFNTGTKVRTDVVGTGTPATVQLVPQNISNWPKKAPITINNTGTVELPRGYQIKLNISYDADMQPDFDDIRFITQDKKIMLPYWIESKIDGITAIVWVKLLSPIPGGGSIQIYMLYGNASATSESSGKNIFNAFGLKTREGPFGSRNTHTLFLRADGTVWSWGRNYTGELGDSTRMDRLTPVQVVGLSDIVDIASQDYTHHSIVLRADGTVWSWGDNNRGQLGDGTEGNFRVVPVQVKDPTGKGFLTDVIDIAVGSDFSLALRADGTVWSWGRNREYGQLGIGATTPYNSSLPVQVKDSAGTGYLSNIVAISGAKSSAYAIKSDGTLWAWGYNEHGQLGNGTSGTTAHSYLPVQVKDSAGTGYLTNVMAVNGNNLSTSTKALTSDGKLWTWGGGGYGGHGTGEGAAYSLPREVTSLGNNVVAIVNSENTGGAITSDGALWLWGNVEDGGFGEGDGSTSNLPKKTIHTDVVSASRGEPVTFILKADGTVWGWGRGDHMGNLGNGTSGNAGPYLGPHFYTPVKINVNFGGRYEKTGGIYSIHKPSDIYFVRGYAPTEPTYSIGAEE